ncbi:unnamed protein product [Rotaria magnacalcarata]|nr:unnamed protein product [Rotaria magnacalcarata]
MSIRTVQIAGTASAVVGVVTLPLQIIDLAISAQALHENKVCRFKFGESFRIPTDQCQTHITARECGIYFLLHYDNQTYEVTFGEGSLWTTVIHIKDGPYLTYGFSYRCSTGNDCASTYSQSALDEMIHRDYDAKLLYEELEMLIENSTRNGSIHCYDFGDTMVSCSSDQVCLLGYDDQEKSTIPRGCKVAVGARISVYDIRSRLTVDIECTRNLCNDYSTLLQITTILNKNNLTNIDVLQVSAGRKYITTSSTFVTLALVLLLAVSIN